MRQQTETDCKLYGMSYQPVLARRLPVRAASGRQDRAPEDTASAQRHKHCEHVQGARARVRHGNRDALLPLHIPGQLLHLQSFALACYACIRQYVADRCVFCSRAWIRYQGNSLAPQLERRCNAGNTSCCKQLHARTRGPSSSAVHAHQLIQRLKLLAAAGSAAALLPGRKAARRRRQQDVPHSASHIHPIVICCCSARAQQRACAGTPLTTCITPLKSKLDDQGGLPNTVPPRILLLRPFRS